MVYDGVHNPAARRSDTGGDSHCCADPDAHSNRADANTNTNSAIHTGGNRFEYGFGNSYAYSRADSHADSTIHTGGNR